MHVSTRENPIKLTLAEPRGFCAGVERAIAIVNRALELFSDPIYMRHEIVHNSYVVNKLRASGVHFVSSVSEVPEGSILIFSAHGVSPSVVKEAKKKCLKVFDATCPLVTKVHMEVCSYAEQGRDCVLIGHENHPEVEGTLGQYRGHKNNGEVYLVENIDQARTLKVNQPDYVSYVTQTTLSLDDTQKIISLLKKRFPKIIGPSKQDICYATQNRQDAVKAMVQNCDILFVVGSKNSSNSNRLREIAIRNNCAAYLVDKSSQIDHKWLENKTHIGVTAGASAPEELVTEIVNTLKSMGAGQPVKQISNITENVYFNLPKELR